MVLQQFAAPSTPTPAAGRVADARQAHGGFWQHRFVQNVLPFLTSLSVHCGILIVGLLTFTAIQVIRQQPEQLQINASTTELVSDSRPDLVGTTHDQLQQIRQDQSPDDANPNGLNDFPSSKSLDIAGGGPAQADASVIGMGPNSSLIGHGPGVGGNGTDGLRAPWGPRTPGVRNPIFGSPNGVHRVSFVCDASGSMINKMASLKQELGKAVVSLRPIQSFSVIFFNDKAKPDALDAMLVPAIPSNKRRAGVFLDGVTATGSTNPIPGIEAAFQQKPQLIYLLTDGDFPDNDAVLSRIRELNKDKSVKINTIAFVGSGDTDTAFIDLLKSIAKENGGSYKHVSEDELGN